MKIISPIFTIVLAIFLLSACSDKGKQYVLTQEETLELMTSDADVISAEKLADIVLSKNPTYQLIDIRTPHDFAIDHVEGAINVPFKDLLDESNLHILNQNKVINILYCKGSQQSMNAYLMLKQLNYKNLKISLGGFDFIKRHIIDSYGIKSGVYNDEKARYDFAKVVAETPGAGAGSMESEAPKTKKKVVKREKKEVEGGCG